MTSTLFEQVNKIQAGETLGPVDLGYSDFPRSAGWTLKCVIMGITGMEAEVSATAGTDADGFSLTIPASTTAAWRGGRKSFLIEATKTGTGTYIAERGAITVLWNPRVTTAEMTILAAIQAAQRGVALDDQLTTTLDGVGLTYPMRSNPAILAEWEARYIRIVNAQIGQAAGNGGVYAIKMRTPQDNRYASPWYGAYPPPGGRA
jgi:hypothetical protein